MAPHACPNCRQLVHFEVRVCPQCRFTLGYAPALDAFLFLADNLTVWRDRAGVAHDLVVCANNGRYEICNWMVAPGREGPFCRACRHNRTIPDLTVPSVPPRWARVEAAKRRLFQELLRLGLPIETTYEAARHGRRGLVFDFLYDASAETAGLQQIMTGHDGGVVTLNLIEADDVERERIRRTLGEPYRTLLGHFRHEIGHYYWEMLVKDDPAERTRCRAVFGDERIDYEQSKQMHYGAAGGAHPDAFISKYATMHPWEDFAETFAHYLHIVDTLATLKGFDLRMTWPGWAGGALAIGFDPYRASTSELLAVWPAYAFAGNAVNRSMGQPDLYPFLLTPEVTVKLDYVDRLVLGARGWTRAGDTPMSRA